MTIVDAHVHVWEADSMLYPASTTLGLEPDFNAPVELLSEQMEASGVDKAVLVQPSNYDFDNRYLANCLKRYPRKFAGVARIDPVDIGAPRRLTLWVEEHGIRGLRLVPFRILDGSWLNDRRLFPLWEKVGELDIPLCFQISAGHLSQLIDLLEIFISHFPNFKLVLDHMGKPSPEGGPSPAFRKLLHLARCGNVYVKLSGHYALSTEPYPYRDTFSLMQAVYEHFGPQRMMWGSDFPYILGHCGYAKSLELIQSELPFLTDEDKEWVLGRTALSLWSFGPER